MSSDEAEIEAKAEGEEEEEVTDLSNRWVGEERERKREAKQLGEQTHAYCSLTLYLLFPVFLTSLLLCFRSLSLLSQWRLHQVSRSSQDCQFGLAGIGGTVQARCQGFGFVWVWSHGNQHFGSKALYEKGQWASHWTGCGLSRLCFRQWLYL